MPKTMQMANGVVADVAVRQLLGPGWVLDVECIWQTCNGAVDALLTVRPGLNLLVTGGRLPSLPIPAIPKAVRHAGKWRVIVPPGFTSKHGQVRRPWGHWRGTRTASPFSVNTVCQGLSLSYLCTLVACASVEMPEFNWTQTSRRPVWRSW